MDSLRSLHIDTGCYKIIFKGAMAPRDWSNREIILSNGCEMINARSSLGRCSWDIAAAARMTLERTWNYKLSLFSHCCYYVHSYFTFQRSRLSSIYLPSNLPMPYPEYETIFVYLIRYIIMWEFWIWLTGSQGGPPHIYYVETKHTSMGHVRSSIRVPTKRPARTTHHSNTVYTHRICAQKKILEKNSRKSGDRAGRFWCVYYNSFGWQRTKRRNRSFFPPSPVSDSTLADDK